VQQYGHIIGTYKSRERGERKVGRGRREKRGGEKRGGRKEV